jgi:hypothetical protein
MTLPIIKLLTREVGGEAGTGVFRKPCGMPSLGQIIPHRNFYLGLGYNYQRRSELKVESKAAGVGFTWGFGFNTSLLSIEFGRAAYHLAGASNHVSLIFRPDLLYKKLTD